MDAQAKPSAAIATDQLWYKDAIIYQLHVKSFFDSNDDGIGDFPGLISKLDYVTIMQRLKDAGLNSMPGGGGEILDDEVRARVSTKCNTQQWLEVMKAAHQLNITTSATMMFGHVETIYERFEHLVWLRDVQDQGPAS